MILDIDEDRLVVVSDLHLGNPASQAGKTFRAFLDFETDRLALDVFPTPSVLWVGVGAWRR